MDPHKLAGLAPADVFGYFERICSMPHGSGNTRMISDYLVAFAREHDLRYIQDELNDVILFVPGTCGMEEHAPVIIQGHMDMVCEKDADCPIDMDTQGLDITHDGAYIFAKGTTLGGDDGIAVAFALALAADRSIAHPPLEIVITVDEETGMYGAAGIDLSMLKGRTLLNLDSEDEGIFTVACAGGARSTIRVDVQRKSVYGPCVKLVVDGLQGGHSGVEIHKNRANAAKVMGEFLRRINEKLPLALSSFAGGSKDNAIPRSCEATFVSLGGELTFINDIASQLQREIREHYDEPEAVVEAFNVEAMGANAVSADDSKKLISLICAVPNGVQAMSTQIPGLVQTSLNLGVSKLDDALSLTFSVRSSVNREKEQLLAALRALTEQYGGSYSQKGEYPAWEYRDESPLRETMVRIYFEMFGAQPQVVAIHAGLECGLLGEKLPGLDCVSIGPEMHDIHTSREKLGIASVERTWNFIKAVLKSL